MKGFDPAWRNQIDSFTQGRAKDAGQVGGLVPHLVDGGISILQYADDTIIFMEHDLAKARNMKLLLCLFE